MDEEQQPPQGAPLARSGRIVIPFRTLLVLSGPAGAGKSTFARRLVEKYHAAGLSPTTIVSSDFCRALVCDDESNQQVNRDTFDLFYYIIHKRMFQGRFTIADSTALQADSRGKLLELARRHYYATLLLIFNMQPQTYLQRDRSRVRNVGEQVIGYHVQRLQQTLLEVPNEGWDQIYMIDEHTEDVELEIVPTQTQQPSQRWQPPQNLP